MATKTAPKLESSSVSDPASPETENPAPGPAQDTATAVEASQPASAPVVPDFATWEKAYREMLERKLGPGAILPIQGSAHTENLGLLMAALARAQADLKGAIKDVVNGHLKNRYADLGSVWDAWQDAGPRHRLGLVQTAEAGAETVTVTTILGHESGQWIRSSLTLPWKLQNGINPAQAIGSALTYARRYGLAALVGVCPEDDDGNGAGRPAEKVQVEYGPSGLKPNGNGNGGKHPAAERREAKLATAGQPEPTQGVTADDVRKLKADVWGLVCAWCGVKDEAGEVDVAGTKIEAGLRLKEFSGLVPLNGDDLADLSLCSPLQLAQLKGRLQTALLDSNDKIPGGPF